eukprot:TRINITY_DN1914_c0_g2_i4.p1 TRINITY_DN1914_c0_g2~~TRINITY_DN1914_c0_g2_i4.p1  ORF type:complete len:631 (+),score=178.15 TRINITY_DN1914_c0_g2_i4:124-2016(+)
MTSETPALAELMSSSLLPEEACFFYSLFEGKSRGMQIRLTIPETLIVLRGKVQVWLQTGEDGLISCRNTASIEAIESGFYAGARKEGRGSSKWSSRQEYVLVERRWPFVKALDELGFRSVMSELAEATAPPKLRGSSESFDGVGLPEYMQTFVSAALQMRFVTCVTMANGEHVRSECGVGRVEFGADGIRNDTIMDASVPEDVSKELHDKTMMIIKFMQEAHGMLLTMLSCEWLQSEWSNASTKGRSGEYMLNGVLAFEVDPSSYDGHLWHSKELDTARLWLNTMQLDPPSPLHDTPAKARKAVGKLRRRRSLELSASEEASSISPTRGNSPPSEGETERKAATFKRRNSVDPIEPESATRRAVLHNPPRESAATELEMMIWKLAASEELDLPIWKRRSVSELTKAVKQVQLRTQRIIDAQEEVMNVDQQARTLHSRMKNAIRRLESSASRVSVQASRLELQQCSLGQVIDKNIADFREESERVNGFQQATLGHFEALENYLVKLQDDHGVQEKILEETEERLALEIAKRENMKHENDVLGTKVSKERAELEELVEVAQHIQQAADKRLQSLCEWVAEELEDAAANRLVNKRRLCSLERVCEALSFQKYGEKPRVWFGESKGTFKAKKST